MKFSLLTIILILSIEVFGQKFKPLTIDTGREYKIINEDSLLEIWGQGFDKKEFIKINADLSMPTTEDPSTKTYDIRFASGKIVGDKITIVITETNPAYHHEYKIEITKDKYRISYNFLNSGEQVDRKIETKDFKLILNNSDFKKGNELRGYTEFKGKCTKGCWPSHSTFDIKGFFKVTLD